MIQGSISQYTFVNNTFKLSAEVSLPVSSVVMYDVMRVVDSVALFLESHTERFFNSFVLSNIEMPFTKDFFVQSIHAFIEKEDLQIGNIRCVYCIAAEPMFCIYQIQHEYPSQEMYALGVHTELLYAERENPNVKQELSVRTVAVEMIKKLGVYDVLLVDSQGNITEGSKTNVFFVSNNTIYTALAQDVLCGITRKHIFEVAHSLGFTIEERKISANEVLQFDAAFFSGTSPKILPINHIQNYIYGVDNQIVLSMMKAFDLRIENYIKTHKK